jgi:hypothetical protein
MSKPAAAQVESTSFGYQFLHASGGNIPLGLFGDVSGKLSPSMPALTWVGQLAYGHKSDSVGTVDVSSNLLTIGGGVRYAIETANASIKPHVQGLLLVAHSSTGDITVNGVSQSGGSSNDLGIEISAAVDHPLNNGWSATGAIGFQRIFTSSGDNVLVVRVGVVKALGK